jgi:hypothetical protein
MKTIRNSIAVLLVVFLAANMRAQDELNSNQWLSKADILLFNNKKTEAANIYSNLLKKDSSNIYLNFLKGQTCEGKNNHQKRLSYYLKALGVNSDTTGFPTFIYQGSKYVLNANVDSSFEHYTSNTIKGFKFDLKQAYSNIYFSEDNKTMVFVNASGSNNTIHVSSFVNNEWSAPVNITSQIGSMGDCFPSSLSSDGKRIYLSKYDGFDSEILVTSFDGKSWSTMKKLNGNINTRFWDAHACESENGLMLFFSSSRPGGFGGMDIYYANKINNDWGKAVNVGDRINTFLDEDYPYIVDNGKCMLYCSQGPKKGKDKFELYYSHAVNDILWTESTLLSYPINTFDDDLSYIPMTVNSRNFFNRKVLSANGKSKCPFSLTVIANIKNDQSNSEAINKKVIVSDWLGKGKTESFQTSNNGTAEFTLKEGFNHLELSGTGLQSKDINILVPLLTKNDTLVINAKLVQSEDNKGNKTNIWKPK